MAYQIERTFKIVDKKQGFGDAIKNVELPINIPNLTFISKFLLVATFIEDSCRIIMQWSDQLYFMTLYRKYNYAFALLYLSMLVLIMMSGSLLILLNKTKYIKVSCYALIGCICLQIWGYGLITNYSFILKSCSLAGSLFMLVATNEINIHKSKSVFGGLPISLDDKSLNYLPLFGRILLGLLFISTFLEDIDIYRIMIGTITLICSLLIMIGLKSKHTAMFLLIILTVSNVLANNWWCLHNSHPLRDFIKYDFFQTLSIMGGFLLLIEIGPGTMSLDEQNFKWQN